MTTLRIGMAAIALVVSLTFTHQAQAQSSLEPDGYHVQALCFGNYGEGNFWYTVATFDNYEDAEDHLAFLYFLADMGATVNHRGEVDSKTWQKLLDELDLPEGVYVHGFDYRIVPYYNFSRYLATPSQLSLRRI